MVDEPLVVKPLLALVPARGGSESIPRKNLAPVAGRPLLAWTLAAASASSRIDRVVVSTDDEEIAVVARQSGANVPFLRPTELAGSDTPGVAPVLHALEWLDREEGYRPAAVMLLQPTSPLRTSDDIDAAVARMEATACEAVISVTVARHHPQWMRTVDAEGRLGPVLPGKAAARRQDLPPVFALNGAIYLIRRDLLLRCQTLLPEGAVALVMPEERSLDIDTAWELRLANLVLGAAAGAGGGCADR